MTQKRLGLLFPFLLVTVQPSAPLFAQGTVQIKPQHPSQENDLPEGAVSAPLRVFADRVFVSMTVSGKHKADGLIDTGSETSLLNKARVQSDGIKVTGTQQFQGAFIGGLGVQQGILDRLKIGEKEYAGVPMGVVNHGRGSKLEQIDMLLGMDFLSRTRFSFDFANARFILWPFRARLPEVAEGFERETLRISRPPGETSRLLPRVDATFDGKHRVNFLVDSGAGGPYYVAFQKPQELGFAKGAPAGQLRVGTGSRVKTLEAFESHFKTLAFGKMVFEQVPVRVIDGSTGLGPVEQQDLRISNIVLGTPFLKGLAAVHIDLPGSTVVFDRAKEKAK